MIFHVLYLDDNKSVKILKQSQDEVTAQFVDGHRRSRKSKYKIREYNGKKYIIVLGHRYYLDKFRQIEI